MRSAARSPLASALSRPRGERRRRTPSPRTRARSRRQPEGPAQDLHGLQAEAATSVDPEAVDKAQAGDPIKVAQRHYREAVKIDGAKKRYLKLVGNPKTRPRSLAASAQGPSRTAIFVNGADEVTIDGFMARDYKANGFFVTNLNGYTMNHLIAEQTGVYGIYAFNTKGGTIANSEAYYVNDGALLHRADAAAGQADPLDRDATSPAGARRSALARPTCAT